MLRPMSARSQPEGIQLPAPEFTVRQIGVVRSEIKTPADDCWANLVSEIILDPAHFSPESTRGLDDFSHVEVVFLFDRVSPEKVFTSSATRATAPTSRWSASSLSAPKTAPIASASPPAKSSASTAFTSSSANSTP